MPENVTEETVDFSQELYEKNIQEITFTEEYEGGNIDADN